MDKEALEYKILAIEQAVKENPGDDSIFINLLNKLMDSEEAFEYGKMQNNNLSFTFNHSSGQIAEALGLTDEEAMTVNNVYDEYHKHRMSDIELPSEQRKYERTSRIIELLLNLTKEHSLKIKIVVLFNLGLLLGSESVAKAIACGTHEQHPIAQQLVNSGFIMTEELQAQIINVVKTFMKERKGEPNTNQVVEEQIAELCNLLKIGYITN
jgi:hypothetical protein